MNLRQWLTEPVPPWKFWMPQSGFFGGVIFTSLLIAIACAILSYVQFFVRWWST